MFNPNAPNGGGPAGAATGTGAAAGAGGGAAVAKANSTEVYGFVLWITTFVSFALFIAWAFVPDATLESIGITYYPSK